MGVEEAGAGPLAAPVDLGPPLQIIGSGRPDHGDAVAVDADVGGIDLAGQHVDELDAPHHEVERSQAPRRLDEVMAVGRQTTKHGYSSHEGNETGRASCMEIVWYYG